jgi:hypothetical protein
MILDLTDFERLPDPAKHTLWFLRGLRDAIANDFIAEAGSDEEAEEFEKLCCYVWARQGWLRNRITERRYSSPEKFDLLWFIIKRIARMEREAIPGYYIEQSLLTA